MSSRMRGMPFAVLLNWVIGEYRDSRSIFGIPEAKFFRTSGRGKKLFGQDLALPVGPAAGPHTQLAQNIVSAYLCGGRYFELKTVQVMDGLEIAKPCIYAPDECYNTEWSQELSIEEAFEEYVKAWFLLHVLAKEFSLSECPDFIFNMSVGYTLEGISKNKVDRFIEGMKDASSQPAFQECRRVLKSRQADFVKLDSDFIDSISEKICSSVTLSTMHGCPTHEIEAISRYLLQEKRLHTLIKMNPTLLGFADVRDTLKKTGFGYIKLKEESFSHDLGYAPGVEMLRRLAKFAREEKREFGVKISNTLPVKITNSELPGEEMYMSGRSLYPLTVKLAAKLAGKFKGELPVSFSGGADFFNASSILATGIRPVTFATTLLKPGGYLRIRQMAEEAQKAAAVSAKIDQVKLETLAAAALADSHYQKDRRPAAGRKINQKLPATDCFIAPCREGCPIRQDIPKYIREVGEGRFADAFQTIIRENPLPQITGEICDHGCMSKCTRLDYDQPVAIRDLKKMAACQGCGDYSLPQTGFKGSPAAVIGAGPSGLAAAYFLRSLGFPVTVFDQRLEPGGTVAHVIPGFRISADAVNRDMELIHGQGVDFRLGADPGFSLEQLKKQGFKYIYLALGAAKSRDFVLAGDKVQTFPAITFLEEFKKGLPAIPLGKRAAVIGGGNSAMDAARAALRIPGVEKVTVIYRRTRDEMPAHPEEVKAALQEGVVLEELLTPVSFSNGMLRCQKMTLGDVDATGRKKPVPVEDAFYEIPVDSVIPAVGELINSSFFKKIGLVLDDRGMVQADPLTLETSIENVFLGGDALAGPSTIVKAISYGRRAAESIAAKEGLLLEDRSEYRRPCGQEQFNKILSKKGVLCDEKKGSSKAGRCLECHLLCNICAEVCPNRANITVRAEGEGLTNFNQIVHLESFCNRCGNCAVFCPYDGAPYRDKLTLFSSESDFHNSTNEGFRRVAGDKPIFQVRTGGREFVIDINEDHLLDKKTAAVLKTLWETRGYLFDQKQGGEKNWKM